MAWNKPDNPLKGFSYLYLNETEKERLAKTGSVQCRKVDGSEEDRWRITDVIGSGTPPINLFSPSFRTALEYLVAGIW